MLKTGIIDENGKPLSIYREPIGIPESNRHGGFDPRLWEAGLERSLLRIDPGFLKRLRGIVISGNGPTLVPISQSGTPVESTLPWIQTIEAAQKEKIAGATSGLADASFFLEKIYSFARDNPHNYDATVVFLPCPEYLGYVLTGNAYAILPTERFRFYYWTAEAIGKIGLDKSKFPPFIYTGEVFGKITKNASKRFGLPVDIPLIAGGPDFIMSLLGTATIKAGETCDRTGSSEGINHCSTKRVDDPRLFSLPHIAGNLFNISVILSSSGTGLSWFLGLCGETAPDYESAFELIKNVNPGSSGIIFLPHLLPERNRLWPGSAKGAFIGLSAKHGKGEMARAVVESTGFAVKEIIDVMEENGCTVDSLRLSGVSASNPVWCKLRADITGKSLILFDITDSELLGCACAGFSGLGDFDSPEQASAALTKVKEVIDPDMRFTETYNECYRQYKKVSQILNAE